MKKHLYIVSLAAVLALVMTGCGDTSTVDELASKSDEVVLNETDKEIAKQAEEAVQEQNDAMNYLLSSEAQVTPGVESRPDITQIDPSNGDIDVDLTTLDSNMVYAQVYAMMTEPDDYKGKKVRAKGTFAHTLDNGKDYYAVFMSDAAACCSQGMEFERVGEFTYPEDYPEENADIIVEGIFDTYMEGGYTYVTLREAAMTVV